MSEWSSAALGEFLQFHKGVSYQGRYLDKPGLRLLGLGTVVPGGGLNLASARTYSGPVKDRQRIRPGEMFLALTDITQEGRILGSPAMVPPDAEGEFAVTHHVARVEVTKPHLLDTGFLFHLLQSYEFRSHMRAVATGTTVRAVSVADALTHAAPIPPLSEQRAIAHILGTLNDKIELNRRMAETLEDMARAVFKSWFVDFDPVHARAEGRDPVGMDADTAAIFPDSFKDSKLGPIPMEWHVQRLGEHIEAVRGLSYRGAYLSDTGLPLHNLDSIYEGGGYKREGLKRYTGEYRPKHVVEPGDLIVANTEQGFDFLLIGYPALVPERFGSVGLMTHHTYRIRPAQDSPLSRCFLYHLFRSDRFHAVICGFTNGTTVNMLPPDGLQMPLLVVPRHQLVQRFDELVAPTLDLIERTRDQSESLARTRDALLPRLISGEVRVPEAEGLMEGFA